MHASSSETYIRSVPLAKRKALGQYMTPAAISTAAARTLPSLAKGAKVLDPAVGTGELLLAIQKVNPGVNLELHGWDVDGDILEQAKTNLPGGTFEQKGLFREVPVEEQGKFDVIIANPPYFEIKKDTEGFDRKDWVVAEGRPNIYSLFFEYALKLLKPGGHMAFIVPPSMNAGAYFARLRAHLTKNANLTHLSLVRENGEFIDALTSVQIITVQKTTEGTDTTKNKFVVDFASLAGAGPVIFTDKKADVVKAWKGATSLYEAGYDVVTGSVCWNHHKDLYVPQGAHQAGVHYPLVYSKDITKSNTIQHIDALKDRRWLSLPAVTPWRQEALIVNRIVGSLTNPQVRAAVIDGATSPFYAENHVNVVFPRTGVTPSIPLLDVLKALTDTTKVSPYLQALTGNTQLSAKELAYLIPIPVTAAKEEA